MPMLGKSVVLSLAFPGGSSDRREWDPQYRQPLDPQLSVLPRANATPAGRPPHPASWYYDPYTARAPKGETPPNLSAAC